MKIRSTEKEGSKTLLKIVKNPVTAHLPVGYQYDDTGSTDAGEVVDLFNFVQTLPNEEPVVFVVGAYSKGEDVFDYVDQKICFSSYPLSASVACGKITTAFERLWDVL
jgi:rRNA small subunit pseudouridine methyltransferase Nep1